MNSSSKHFVAENGARVEIGVVAHGGIEFEAFGAIVDHERGVVVGYVDGDKLTTWDGQVLGTLVKLSSWPVPQAWMGERMHAYRATVDGKSYFGRGLGDGMSLRLRAAKGG